MSSWLSSIKDIITGGAADVVKSADSLIDNAFTSDEELGNIEVKKEELKNGFKGLVYGYKSTLVNANLSLEQEISKRHASDMN